MLNDKITSKILVVALIGILCYGASLIVLGLVSERQDTFNEAQQEVAQTWGRPQLIEGPVLTLTGPNAREPLSTYHVLPKHLVYEVNLEPEIRSRGIFDSVVYTAKLHVTGAFAAADIASVPAAQRQASLFSLGITDTRGIEKQVGLEWNGNQVALSPGAGDHPLEASTGLHANVPLPPKGEYPFVFDIALKGSEGITFLPVGEETEVKVTSPWTSPKFTGNYLPAERNIGPSGFSSLWRVSSFGRSYPQVLNGDASTEDLQASTFGVDLFQSVDFYTKLVRSVKYAILFIAVTFIAFALFELLLGLRIHSVQYLLVGLTLALFYLLLLSLSEQIGFGWAYLVSTLMTGLLIAAYSYKVLSDKRRAGLVFVILCVLYSYLYFVLRLEDYALLFGSLLLFVLLASVMYLTRNIDWYNLAGSKDNGGKA